MKSILMLLAFSFVVSICGLTDKFKKSMDSNSSSNSNSSNSSGSSSDGAVVHPTPGPNEIAALAGGQSVKWDEQGMTWTFPATWTKQDKEKNSFSWGGGKTAFMNVNISPLGDDFPTDVSLKAYYDSAVTRQKHGELDQLHWMELDGVKGIQWRESKPDKGGDIRRYQWMGYRKFAGQVQLINLILSADSDNFTKRQDEFSGILYSMKIVH